MHTSRRDAFRAINDFPIAKIYLDGKIEYLKEKNTLKINSKTDPKIDLSFSDSVAILKAYPNSDPKIIDWYIKKGYKGLIIEGTGLGHCPTGMGGKDKSFDKNKSWIPHIKKANEKGIIVIMTTQCLFGRVNGTVYANLRYVQDAGGHYLDQHNMLSEVIYIKLSIAIEKFKTKEEIIKYLEKNIAGEISKKEISESFDF
jgi:glutamyl-tRNA(Gln) amidotransferase subunit D